MRAPLRSLFMGALAVFGIVFLSYQGYVALAQFVGPGNCAAGNCSGAIAVDSKNDVGLGLAATTTARLYVVASTTPGSYAIFSSGTVALSTSSAIKFGDGTTQTTAASGGATLTSANVSSGDFGSNTGGGNYSFPANLGIGTTTPTSVLDVHSAAGDTLFDGSGITQLRTPGESISVSGGINVTSANAINLKAQTGANPVITFSTNFGGAGVERMRISSGGFVGVGTTTPTSLLTMGTTTGNGAFNSGLPQIIFGSAGTQMGLEGAAGGSALMVKAGTASNLVFRGGGIDMSSANSIHWTNANNNPMTTIDTTIWRSAAGVVNIGTTGQNASGTLVAATIGIGTTTPAGQLELNSTAVAQIMRFTAPNYGQLDFYEGATLKGIVQSVGSTYAVPNLQNSLMFYNATAGGPDTFSTNNLERMRIDAAGNVGIATTTPGSPLTVAGTIYSSTGGFKFPDGTTQTTASAGGGTIAASNVTAGTFGAGAFTFPSTLTVNGDVHYTGQEYTSGSASTYGAVSINSVGKAGWSGINFRSGVTNYGTFMFRSDGYSGVYNPADSGWVWAFDNTGVLAAGSVPWTFVTGKPTAVSAFTNDSGYITAGATALSAATVTFGGGTGKITVGTVDPVYTIGGTQYATYLPGMTGQKEETSGNIQCPISNNQCAYTIDLKNLKEGSDLWLFAKATDLVNHFGDMTVLLTPAFDGKVWYEKDVKNLRLILHASPAPRSSQLTTHNALPTSLELSYRLTAPRFDASQWTNHAPAGSEAGFNLDSSHL